MSQRNELGRPPILDDKKKTAICTVLALGGTRAIAAAYVGCHPDTIRNTELRDEEFARELENAESQLEMKQLSYIATAGKESRHWRAAAWVLEHRYPTRYGRRRPDCYTLEQMSHVLAQFAGVILDVVSDPDQRNQIVARLAELTSALQTSAVGESR